MTPLLFFSTNRVKLAHFKHLARNTNFEIVGFTQKSYYASYHEPRTSDRDILLRESYESALEKWMRLHRGHDPGFFFFEDTSVRIDALSSNSETPGVDVKYWMRSITFAKLDSQLRKLGNNRRVSVR